MTEILIDTDELEGFADALRRAAGSTKDEMRWAMEAAVKHLEGEERSATPHGATGQAAASWRSFSEVMGHEVIGTVENTKLYVDVLDRGANAGPWRALPPHDDEASGLLQWVRRKLGLADEEARSAAFLIARKIRRRGFTDRHQNFVSTIWYRSRPYVERVFDAALNRWSRKIAP